MTTVQADIGHVTIDNGDLQVVFRRRYAKPVEKVWAAVSTPERIADWLAIAEYEPKVGGVVRLDWYGHNKMEGRVVAYDPPRLFAWTWPLNGRETVVRFALEPDGPLACWLTLTHAGLDPAGAGAGVRVGWHAHLEGIPDALEGRATSWETVMARNTELTAFYPPLPA